MTKNNIDIKQYVTQKQYQVIECLQYLSGRFTSYPLIAKATGLPHHSVCTVMRALRSRQIVKTTRVNILGRKWGVSCRILVDNVAVTEGGENSSNISSINFSMLPLIEESSYGHPHIDPHSKVVVSSLSLKKTTNYDAQCDADKVKSLVAGVAAKLDATQEIQYWRDQGLSPRHVVSWISDLGVTIDDVIISLCHLRWDLLHEGKDKTIRNPLNYFFGSLKKYGCYSKPNGYLSFDEIKIQKEKKEADEQRRKKEAHHLAIESARNKNQELVIKNLYLKIIEKPESELFNRVFAKLQEEHGRLIGRDMRSKMMRALFCDVINKMLIANIILIDDLGECILVEKQQ